MTRIDEQVTFLGGWGGLGTRNLFPLSFLGGMEPWVDYKADDLLAANGITSWILRLKRMYWKQVRMIAEHHEGRWTERISNWNPAISTKQEGTKKKVGWPRDGKTPTTHTYQPRHPRSHERHDLAHHGTRWIETGLDGQLLYEQQTQETNTTHHDYDNPTNNTRTHNVHGSSPRPRRRRQQRRRKRRRRYATHFLRNRQLNLRNTRATTAKETRVNHISSFWDRCRPTLF